MGNKCFSSTNAISDKDVAKKDDIVSIFYILIYFFNRKLPWSKKISENRKYTREEIIEIRKSLSIREPCKEFPTDFINLTEQIFNMPDLGNPDYYYIINELNKIKEKEECRKKNE